MKGQRDGSMEGRRGRHWGWMDPHKDRRMEGWTDRQTDKRTLGQTAPTAQLESLLSERDSGAAGGTHGHREGHTDTGKDTQTRGRTHGQTPLPCIPSLLVHPLSGYRWHGCDPVWCHRTLGTAPAPAPPCQEGTGMGSSIWDGDRYGIIHLGWGQVWDHPFGMGMRSSTWDGDGCRIIHLG